MWSARNLELMAKTKIRLTQYQREEIREALAPLGPGVGIDRKADIVSRRLGVTHSEAKSLLAQCRKTGSTKRKANRRRESWEERNDRRFRKISAGRPDLY